MLNPIIKQSPLCSPLTMINHLAAICRYNLPNYNFFPGLSLAGWLGASIGICFFVILKNYFQYFCPVLSILIYFRVFPEDEEECSIFLTFSTFLKNADFFFWAIMEQDTTGIVCFIIGFFGGCTSWWSQRSLRCHYSSSYLVLFQLCHKRKSVVWSLERQSVLKYTKSSPLPLTALHSWKPC